MSATSSGVAALGDLLAAGDPRVTAADLHHPCASPRFDSQRSSRRELHRGEATARASSKTKVGATMYMRVIFKLM